MWKRTVSVEFRVIHPKLCGNCAYPQIFHTRKLGEITVFHAICTFKNDLSITGANVNARVRYILVMSSGN